MLFGEEKKGGRTKKGMSLGQDGELLMMSSPQHSSLHPNVL